MTAASSGPAPPPAPTRPRLSLVIASLPRSGSWLLADGLEATGVAGHPREYLRPELERRYTTRWGLAPGAPVRSFVAGMLDAGTTENGVFGLKVHWQDCARLVMRARAAGARGRDADVIASLLPGPRYVHLVRRDVVAQAVSWCKALDTNTWWQVGQPARSASDAWDPDYDKVEVLHDLLVDQAAAWRRMFAQAAITPLEVVYEDLVETYESAIRAVLAHIGVDLPEGSEVPAPALRRQADGLSMRWVAGYLHLQRTLAPERAATGDVGLVTVPSPASAGPAAAPAVPGTGGTAPPASAASVAHRPGGVRDGLGRRLRSRTWRRRAWPFPHIVATDVFTPVAYAALDSAFTGLLAGGEGDPASRFGRSTPGYDVLSLSFRPGTEAPFDLFVSRAWHDLVGAVAGVRGSGHVFAGMHHHLPGSGSGAVHNDLNPGFFPAPGTPGTVVLNDHRLVDYHTGQARSEGVAPVETVRGVALILFLHNPPWHPGDGGEVGLYRSASDPIDRPAAVVPPVNNSLVLFECTPHSFHGFLQNRRTHRSSLIMWIHRDREGVVARWGADAIVPWVRG